MNQSDFRVSGPSKFDFGFSSTATSRSGYGRARPRRRFAKLRKPKSSFLGQGGESGYNPFRNDVSGDGRGNVSGVFGWRREQGSVAGGGYDVASATQLPNEFRKLNVGGSDGNGAGGWLFSSFFEFGSKRNDGGSGGGENGGLSVGVLPEQLRKLNLEDSGRDSKGKSKSDSLGYGHIGSSFSGLSGSTEAMLSQKMEHVRIGERVGVSATGAAGDTSSHQNLKNGIKDEYKENVFFQGSGFSIPTASQIPATPPTNLTNGGSGFISSNAPAADSSAATFSYQHGTNFFLGTVGNKDFGEGFNFTGKSDGTRTPGVNSSLNRKAKLVPKRHAGKDSNLKKKKENVKPNTVSREDLASFKQEFDFKHFSSLPESPQSYSPMDVSPYPEVRVNDQHSNEASVTSEESLTQGSKFQSLDGDTYDENRLVDEDLVYAARQLNIGEVCINVGGTNMDNSEACASEHIGKTLAEESASGTETESFKSAPNDLDSNIDNSPSAATRTCSSSNSGGDGTTNFYSVCNGESTDGTKFTFTASTSSKEPASLRRYKKINRRKEFDSYRSTATSKVSNPFSGGLQLNDSLQNKSNANSTSSQSKAEKESNTNTSKDVINESSGTPAANIVALEACEKWRLRGNQAYANGDPFKAEEYYTRGVKSIPVYEKSRDCLKALMLCYSNRAATRMSMGRLREAVEDCKLAAGIDPSFLKAHLRAGNCFLALGEVEEASKYFKYCLQSGMGVSVDRKILIEASEGLQKARKAAECTSLSIENIQRGTCSDAENALRLADEALTISFYSEKLLEIKAEALFLLQKYSKVIHLCEDSLEFAERNTNTDAGVHNLSDNSNNALIHGRVYFRLWRCRLMLKSYFFLGKLEEALAVLEKNESLRKGSETLESLIPLVATIRTLLQYKGVGNEAFQSGKYAEAIEHYTAALSFNVDSHPFAAICFCNRAAAYKALGKIIDAIADCNLAITLERDYLKAISRRASLYESIRDYGHAASDVEIIVSLLKQQTNASRQTTSYEKPTKLSIPMDLRQAQMLLTRLEKQASKGIPLNFYLILGIESCASAAEIKKAYRHAALKHHPDKAGQILAKGNSGRNGTWKEIIEEIHRDADRLFKMIGEAYTILSDPAQRSVYDAEEEIRELLKKNGEPVAPRTHVDTRNYPFEGSRSRRHWNNGWRSYGH